MQQRRRSGSSLSSRLVKVFAVVLMLLVVMGGVGAYAFWRWLRVEPIPADTPAAVARFTAVLNGAPGEMEALRMLAGAVDRDPRDPKARLWFGLANMYMFIQNDETPFAIRTSMALSRAVRLDPTNKSAEGWRSFFEYMGAGRNGTDKTEAIEALFAAGEADPKFSSFLVAVAVAREPLSSGLPQRALAPLEAAGDCGDGTTYTCRISALHPHAPEGYHATVGDLRVRLGDLVGGMVAYRKALAMPTADTWPYRSAFEQWVKDAPKRAERLANDDPDDDPPVFFGRGKRACAVCHHANDAGV